MTDTNTSGDTTSRGDEIKAQAKQLIENVKAEITQRLDQLLDEIGALI